MYFLGKSLAEFPLFLLVPFIFTTISYPMVGLRPTFFNYLVALFIVSLVANVATSFGMTFTMFPSILPNLFDTFPFIYSRLFHIMRQFVCVNGTVHRSTNHNSISPVRRFLPQCWLRADLLQMAFVSVVVSLW